jgi:aspartate racemase
MKAIGLLGGMSWESTQVYYRLINQFTSERLGGLHSAKIWLHSVDFFEIEQLQRRGDWETAGKALASAAQGLERAGADFIVLCTNTMHIVAAQIQQACSIPLLHIADATAERTRRHGIGRVGLLGTRFTMEKDFYAGRVSGFARADYRYTAGFWSDFDESLRRW